MKITILGTNGFLSTAIAEYAQKQGWQLDMYGLDIPTGHRYDNFFRINLMNSELDCKGLLSSDVIVYAIGAGIQSNLNEGNSIIYHLNVTVPVTICNRLKELDYQGTIVTFGSVFEIGETKEERCFNEKDILTSCCQPPNDYAVSKRLLSRFVTSYKHDYSHWHFILPTIYGAGENPKRLIPYTIYAIKNKEELHFTSGIQTRQYLHVSEVPRMIDMAIRKKLPSGIYNVEGNETLTVKEIVGKIHNAMGKEVPKGCFGTAQRTDVGMKYLALDGQKLKNAIGFDTVITLAEAISSY